MTQGVSILSMLCMLIAALAGFAIPVILFLYLRKKKRCDILPFFIGVAVMFVFALVLESLLHQLVLLTDVGKTIFGNSWLYALYGGLMAGLFEEGGRFLAFKTVLRRYQARDVNALMYGAGHASCEVVMLFSATMISNLVLSVMINAGLSDRITGALEGDMLLQVQASLDALVTTPPASFLLGFVERLFAVVLQISFSVLVWFGAKKREKWYLFPLAILLHFFVDAATVVCSGLGLPLLAVEAVIGALAACVALLARWIWKKNVEDPEKNLI